MIPADGTHEAFILEHRMVVEPAVREREPGPPDYALWTSYAQGTSPEAVATMLAELRPATVGRLEWRAVRVVTTVDVLDL